MTTQSAVFTFALPEDSDSDLMEIYECSTENGTYSLATTVSYEYGTTVYEYDSLNDVKWYKIRFKNSTDSEVGPYSNPVYGGSFDNASPFLAISTTTDGANYATTQDVYDYSTLTTNDVTSARVSQALRRARAIVDLQTAQMDLDRFERTFDSDIARRKYNASLQIIKEAEINIALGNVYRGLADDVILIKHRRAISGQKGNVSSVSIGGQSVTLSDELSASGLMTMSNRYLSIGGAMLASLQPPSVRLHYESDYLQSPTFRYPFNGY